MGSTRRTSGVRRVLRDLCGTWNSRRDRAAHSRCQVPDCCEQCVWSREETLCHRVHEWDCQWQIASTEGEATSSSWWNPANVQFSSLSRKSAKAGNGFPGKNFFAWVERLRTSLSRALNSKVAPCFCLCWIWFSNGLALLSDQLRSILPRFWFKWR